MSIAQCRSAVTHHLSHHAGKRDSEDPVLGGITISILERPFWRLGTTASSCRDAGETSMLEYSRKPWQLVFPRLCPCSIDLGDGIHYSYLQRKKCQYIYYLGLYEGPLSVYLICNQKHSRSRISLFFFKVFHLFLYYS